jgi:DNA-binding transcriptional MerR regulator
MGAAMNIQALARRTGIPAATLRKWEQRYGVLKPERTPGAHRRYSERDILRVEWLKARMSEGYRIGEAAHLLGEEPTTPAGSSRELVAELVDATRRRDHARLVRAIDQAFVLLPPELVIAEVVEPALTAIGDLWEHGTIGVADEHHLTELLRAKLRALLEGAEGGSRGTAVLCCAPGERHENGLLALGVLLYVDGWRIVYLGADTPLANAAALAEAVGARVVCVSATMPEAALAAKEEVAALAPRHGPLAFVLGGPGFGHGEHGREAVARLRTLVAA